MKYSKYKFKFYLNANHAIYLGGVLGQNHPHTWEVILDTVKLKDGFVQFDYIEKSVEKFLLKFQDKAINSIEPFNVTNPTLENLTVYFKSELEELLGKNGWLLNRIEVSETPTRSYIIDSSDEVSALIAKEAGEQPTSIAQAADRKLSEILGDKVKS